MMTYRFILPLLIPALNVTYVQAQSQSITSLNVISSTKEGSPAALTPKKPMAGESPVYIKAYGFYGLLTPGSQINYSSSASSTGTATSFKTNSKGLGAGLRAGVGIGVIASDFINLGVDAELLFGDRLPTENVYPGSNYVYTSTSVTTFRVLSIIPNITFKALSRPSYYIYNRLGLVGGVVLDYSIDQNALSKPNVGASTTYVYQTKYRENTLALGYQAALGIQFRISQSLRGYAEVVGYNQSFQPKEILNTTVSTQSGKVTTSSNITQYKKQGDYGSTKQDGVDVYQSPAYNIAMNSIGVGVGLLFRF